MANPEGFTRRICAVLLADVSGYSALVGKDDERTARAVRELQEVVCTLIVEAKGQAEARAGDSIFATFDSVVVAVDTALMILRHLATEDFHGQRLQLRIGVHFGDVLLRDGGTFHEAVGDAINIAARLQTLAKPGAVCISEGVYRHVQSRIDETFVDLGRQKLKNISDPVHAYLIIPRGADITRRPAHRRRVTWGVGAALALLLAGSAVSLHRYLGLPDPSRGIPLPRDASSVQRAMVATEQTDGAPVEQMALGVMVFKSRGESGGDDWRREALRDGLNTQLSRLSHVKVYSKEFIDFLISRKGLSEIEAATELGIRKMLSGSCVATGGRLQIEIHVVDVQSGVLESSYTASGSEDHFLDLQNQLTMGVMTRLNLPVSDAEKQILLAQQTTDVDALKLLMEAEGGVATTVPTPAHSEPQSWLPGQPWRLLEASALADSGPAEDSIRAVLEEYRRAMEAGEVGQLAELYAHFPPELQAAQQRYFENVRQLKVAIDKLDIAVVGDEAVVSYTRTDDFTDARTGRPMHVAVRVTKVLRQADGSWKLTAQ